MEYKGNQKESNTSAAVVYKLPGETAVVINGVPSFISSCNTTTTPLPNAPSTVETQGPSGLGEWIEGREVRKRFKGRYYSGTVTEFCKDSGWYRVLYEDGDSEHVEWRELEEILVPLDVTIPLKILAQRNVGKNQKSCQKRGKNIARS